MIKEYRIHSVKYNIIMNVILKMSTFLFPLITFPYISRILGPIGNGKISFAVSVIYYFTVIATLGIPTYGVKICAKYRDDNDKIAKVVKELLIISSIMMIVSYIIFFASLYFIPKLQNEKGLMIINSFTIFLTVFGVEWFYQAIEQYDYITFRNLAFKVLSIALMFLFVHESEDYLLYGAITVLGTTGSNILNILRLKKYINLKGKYNLELKIHVKPILVLFMLTAATMIYTSLDSTMLGFISGDKQVGFYNAATKLKSILVSFVTSLGIVLLPRLSNCLHNKDFKQFNTLIKKSFNFVFLSSLPLCIYSILLAPQCIDFLAGEGYHNAIVPMQLISPSIIFIGITNVIGIQILIPKGFEKLTVFSTIIGAIVNVILNSILIPLYAASGAAFATTIAELSVLLIQIYFVKKDLLSFIDIKNFIKVSIASICSIISLFFLLQISFMNSFITILTTGSCFFFVYGIVLIVLKEEIITSTMQNILKKMKRLMQN